MLSAAQTSMNFVKAVDDVVGDDHQQDSLLMKWSTRWQYFGVAKLSKIHLPNLVFSMTYQ